jgi:two-component system, OmpR family, response regulator
MGRVLVVDDDHRVGRLLTRVLEQDGQVVEHAVSGRTGLCMALAADFDLIILDLMLPDLDGEAVLAQVLEAHPEQRVLVLSAVPEVGVRVACLEDGAVDFVGKPFVVAELLARVHLRMKDDPPAERYLADGQVCLDLRRRKAEVSGREVDLTQREFSLLLHLMRRKGRSCSRSELLADVWGLTFDPGTNVVDVCVRRLRAKLDRPERVETVRNVGYRFLPA